jgi:hypothetical protein
MVPRPRKLQNGAKFRNARRLRWNWTFIIVVAVTCITAAGYFWLYRSIQTHSNPSNQQPDTRQPSDGAAAAAAVDLTAQLPPWMQVYFTWHAQQILTINDSQGNNNKNKYLVYRCLKTDPYCGGLSDRMKSLPLLVLLAARSNRVLLYHWSRPCLLQEFLLPPPGGLDWRVPNWLVDKLATAPVLKQLPRIIEGVQGDKAVVTVRLQDQHGGSDYYNEQVRATDGERAFRTVFRTLFYVVFEPAPALRAEIASGMMMPSGSYAAAHVRALYNEARDPLPESTIGAMAVNAINCAHELRPNAPTIFFASDSNVAVKAALDYGRRAHKNIVTLKDNDHDPLHLDKAGSVNPADYYSVFRDLFVLANAECIAHGQGGYGRMAVLLSRNASCLKPFITGGRYIECTWKD